MLKDIMHLQAALQKKLGVDFSSMNDKDRAKFMRDHYVYLDQELQEALYEMPYFKDWKDYSGMDEEAKNVAWQKVRMELVDSLHFFTNLLLCAGMTAEEVYGMYLAKNKEDHRRQEAGYTADVSYREQPVEEVMQHTMCTVSIDGDTKQSDNFIAILNGNEMLYKTDIVALGLSAIHLRHLYQMELSKLPDEVREAIESDVNRSINDEQD